MLWTASAWRLLQLQLGHGRVPQLDAGRETSDVRRQRTGQLGRGRVCWSLFDRQVNRHQARRHFVRLLGPGHVRFRLDRIVRNNGEYESQIKHFRRLQLSPFGTVDMHARYWYKIFLPVILYTTLFASIVTPRIARCKMFLNPWIEILVLCLCIVFIWNKVIKFLSRSPFLRSPVRDRSSEIKSHHFLSLFYIFVFGGGREELCRSWRWYYPNRSPLPNHSFLLLSMSEHVSMKQCTKRYKIAPGKRSSRSSSTREKHGAFNKN